MKIFGSICYAICMVSIVTCLILALLMIWMETTDDFMWKALGTALACFLASGIAFALNREFMKEPGLKQAQDERK
jgi:hypothetical protein